MRYGKLRQVYVTSFDGAYVRSFCRLRQKQLTVRRDKLEEAVKVAGSTPPF